jgi:hypothetical protein
MYDKRTKEEVIKYYTDKCIIIEGFTKDLVDAWGRNDTY